QALEKPARLDDGRVLDRRGDDVISPVLECEEHALEREVVGLAAAAREHDLIPGAAEQSRYLATGCVQSILGRDARPMSAGRISEPRLQKRAHGRRDRTVDWGARIVVEVDSGRICRLHLRPDIKYFTSAAIPRISTTTTSNPIRPMPQPIPPILVIIGDPSLQSITMCRKVGVIMRCPAQHAVNPSRPYCSWLESDRRSPQINCIGKDHQQVLMYRRADNCQATVILPWPRR